MRFFGIGHNYSVVPTGIQQTTANGNKWNPIAITDPRKSTE